MHNIYRSEQSAMFYTVLGILSLLLFDAAAMYLWTWTGRAGMAGDTPHATRPSMLLACGALGIVAIAAITAAVSFYKVKPCGRKYSSTLLSTLLLAIVSLIIYCFIEAQTYY